MNNEARNMKVGDLVRSPDGHLGFILRVDKDFYGARQAIKRYKVVERGKCIRSDMGDGIGPTKRGIRDRVLVLWTNEGDITYEESIDVEVISES